MCKKVKGQSQGISEGRGREHRGRKQEESLEENVGSVEEGSIRVEDGINED